MRSLRSIRSRLLVSLAVVTVTTFALAAGTTFVLFRRALLQEFDSLLGAKARTLAMLAEPEREGVVFEFQEHGLVDFTRAFEPEFYEAWTDDGKVIADSGHADKLPKLPPGTLDAPRFRFIKLPDGRPGRMIAVRFLPFAEEAKPQRAGVDWVTLIVARDTEQMDHALQRMIWVLSGVSVAPVATLLALLSWIVLRSLRPLETFARQIARIGESDLATRIAADEAPAEMVPVITGFNGLLERVESAFNRERTFSSNVAHELRTPLAGLLATIQVTLSRTRASDEYRDALARCEEISHGTHRLVETLLSLSRLEAGRGEANGHVAAVDSLIDDQWARFAGRAEEKQITCHRGEASGDCLAVDGDQLQIVLANLFDNAVEYTDPGGTIEISCQPTQAGLALRVDNGPCHLSAANLPHVFEQFWRGDAARSNTGTHSGLGLALSKRIIEAMDGTITATLEGNRFVATITFNAAQLSRIPPLAEVAR